MIKFFSLAALAAATLVAGGVQAHEQGGYGYQGGSSLPPPAYAYDSRAYTVYERPVHRGFPLLGGDAGITVLGLHLGGSAKIRLGVDDELQPRRRVYVSRSRAAAPPPAMHGYGDRYGPPPSPHWDRQDNW